MHSADQIFIDGIWQEQELLKTEQSINCIDSSSHLSQDPNELKFELMTLNMRQNVIPTQSDSSSTLKDQIYYSPYDQETHGDMTFQGKVNEDIPMISTIQPRTMVLKDNLVILPAQLSPPADAVNQK